MAVPPRKERTIAIYPPTPPEPSVLCLQVPLLIAPVATAEIAPTEEVAVAAMIVPDVAVVLTIRITRTKKTNG